MQRSFASYLELGRLEGQLAGNDTLSYLTGYCLMELGEGSEALAYFAHLQGRHAAWNHNCNGTEAWRCCWPTSEGRPWHCFKN